MDKSDVIIIIGILFLVLGALDTLHSLYPEVLKGAANTVTATRTVSVIKTMTLTRTVTETVAEGNLGRGVQSPGNNTSTPPSQQTGATPLQVVEYNYTKYYSMLEVEGAKVLLTHTVIPILYFNVNTSMYQYFVAVSLDLVNASSRTRVVLSRIVSWEVRLQLYGLNETVSVYLDNVDPEIGEPGFIRVSDNVLVTRVPPLGYVVVLDLTGLLPWRGSSTLSPINNELARLVDLRVDMDYTLEFSTCNASVLEQVFECPTSNHTIPYSANVSINYSGCIGLYITYNEYWDSYIGEYYPVIKDISYIVSGNTGESLACPTGVYVIEYLPYHILYAYYLARESELSPPSSTHAPRAAEILLQPVYSLVNDPNLGPIHLLEKFYWTGQLGGSTVEITAYPMGFDAYGNIHCNVEVFIDGNFEGFWQSITLPTLISVEIGEETYTLRLEPPEPPQLNTTLELEARRVGVYNYSMPNGSTVNIEIYSLEESRKLQGNVTIVVICDFEGYKWKTNFVVSVAIYGVPPSNYTVSVNLPVNDTYIEYQGALVITLVASYLEPIEARSLALTIEPLDLKIIITPSKE